MWISNTRSDRLREGASSHELEEVPRGAVVAGHTVHTPGCHQTSLHTLVQNEVDYSLTDPHIRSCYAFIEPPYTLKTTDTLNHLENFEQIKLFVFLDRQTDVSTLAISKNINFKYRFSIYPLYTL